MAWYLSRFKRRIHMPTAVGTGVPPHYQLDSYLLSDGVVAQLVRASDS